MIDETAKYADRKVLERQDQLREADKPKPPRKEGKSPFDEMLDQSRLAQQSTLDSKSQNKTATQQATQEVERQKERQQDRSKDKDKEEEHKQNSREDRQQTDISGKKVVAKAGLKEQKRESGGESSEGGGSGYKKSGSSAAALKKSAAEAATATGNKTFARAFQKALAQTTLPKTLPQEILNQLVRYVRVGLSREGQKEVELDLHQNIFKGLRLRLSSNRGKVTLHFLTANPGVRKLFEKESSHIRETLQGKGITVEAIQVT